MCKYYIDGECTADILEEEVVDCDACPYFVEYDPYDDWIKDEDAKLHFQERCRDEND